MGNNSSSVSGSVQNLLGHLKNAKNSAAAEGIKKGVEQASARASTFAKSTSTFMSGIIKKLPDMQDFNIAKDRDLEECGYDRNDVGETGGAVYTKYTPSSMLFNDGNPEVARVSPGEYVGLPEDVVLVNADNTPMTAEEPVSSEEECEPQSEHVVSIKVEPTEAKQPRSVEEMFAGLMGGTQHEVPAYVGREDGDGNIIDCGEGPKLIDVDDLFNIPKEAPVIVPLCIDEDIATGTENTVEVPEPEESPKFVSIEIPVVEAEPAVEEPDMEAEPVAVVIELPETIIEMEPAVDPIIGAEPMAEVIESPVPVMEVEPAVEEPAVEAEPVVVPIVVSAPEKITVEPLPSVIAASSFELEAGDEGTGSSDDPIIMGQAFGVAATAVTSTGAEARPAMDDISKEALVVEPAKFDDAPRKVARFAFIDGRIQRIDEEEVAEPEPVITAEPVVFTVSDEVADVMKMTVPELDMDDDTSVDMVYDTIPADGMEELVFNEPVVEEPAPANAGGVTFSFGCSAYNYGIAKFMF